MNAITYNTWNPRHLGYVIVFTILVNGSLFAALPWLTHFIEKEEPITDTLNYIVFPRNQPKPPEPIRDKKIIEQVLLPPPKPIESMKQNLQHDFDFVPSNEWSDNDVLVKVLDPKTVIIDPKNYIVEREQLDKEPRIIRRIPPAYPFTAKRQGIKARVKISCLVDKDGIPQKVVATECDPEDALEIFGPPSVEAVKKWRFSPGEIGGDPVLTRVSFNLFFELDS